VREAVETLGTHWPFDASIGVFQQTILATAEQWTIKDL